MTRLEKVQFLKEKGYKYDPETGKVYGVKGMEIISKHSGGYIIIRNTKYFSGNVYAHHYAYFMTYGNVDFEMLDHINRIKTDNRISNLRIVTSQQNHFNRSDVKGYGWHKSSGKWRSYIMINQKQISLGYFNTEEEALNAYLRAKEKYHTI